MALAPARVLLVEDDPTFAKVVRAMLIRPGQTGFELETATRWAGAMVRLAQDTFDAILLDLELPDSHGLETFMRARASAPEAPIVILTGSTSDPEMAEYAIRNGAQDYLLKSQVQADSLARSIRYAIERKRIELRLMESLRELAASNRSLEEFAAVVSHDLKAPLRALGLLSDVLEEDLAAGEYGKIPETLGKIRDRSQKMSQLINGIMEAARAHGGDRHVERVDANTSFERALEALNVPPGFVVEKGPELGSIVTEGYGLQRVLQNLLGNAIQHHDKSEGKIRVSAQDAGRFLLFSVEDDGPGIPVERRTRLFEPFSPNAGDETRGTGLGLSIVKEIVESQGGSVAIDGPTARGTRVLFTWPKAGSISQPAKPAGPHDGRVVPAAAVTQPPRQGTSRP